MNLQQFMKNFARLRCDHARGSILKEKCIFGLLLTNKSDFLKMGEIDLIKKLSNKIDHFIKKLYELFQKREKRSESLKDKVKKLISLLVALYQKIIAISSEDILPSSETLETTILNTYTNLKNIKEESIRPFFDLLDWVKKMLVYYLQTLFENKKFEEKKVIIQEEMETFEKNTDKIFQQSLEKEEIEDEKLSEEETLELLISENQNLYQKLVDLKINFIKAHYQGKTNQQIVEDFQHRIKETKRKDLIKLFNQMNLD